MAALETIELNAKRLSRETARRGLIRGQVAKIAGVSPGTITKAYRGRRIAANTAKRIADAVGVDLAMLVANEPAGAVA